MRLSKIQLHPFAGVQDQTYTFEKGMNVLLGPNEAGKSTIFQAVLHGLLTTTSLTRTKVDKLMGAYFPRVGGDVIRVNIELKNSEDKVVTIDKAWKKGNRNGSASLKKSDGSEVTDEDTVQKHIEAMLPVSPATLRTIMLANQSSLHETMRTMEEEGEVRKELGNILRKSLMETGGVSVDEFRELLDQKYESYYKRWDRQQQYPKNNRGIKNPYKTGPTRTGTVIEAFYKKEQLQLDLDEARRYEDELDALNEKLNTLIAKQDKKIKKYENLNPLKEGVQKRQIKEQKLETATEKRKILIEVIEKWPILKEKVKNLTPKVKDREEEISKLNKEKKQAQNKQKAKRFEEQIKKIEELSAAVDHAKKEVKEARKVSQDEIKKLRKLQSEIQQKRTKIEAAKLTIRIKSNIDQHIIYSEAGNDEEKIEIKEGQSVEQTASGGFTFQSDDLNLEVFSGEGDLEQIIKALEAKEKKFGGRLKELEADSMQDAESYAELYRQKKSDLSQAEANYKNELDGQRLKKLKEKLNALGDLSDVREFDEIADEVVEAKTVLNGIKQEAQEAKEQLKEWKNKYESYEKVSIALGDASSAIRDLEKELEDLPTLPDQYDSPEEFMDEINRLDRDIEELKDRIFEKKQKRTQLEANAPDTSSEELEKLLEDAQAQFEQVRRRAETVASVRDKSISLIKSMDSKTYEGLESAFIKWLNLMIGERFTVVDMDEDIPAGFETEDKTSLTYNLLSHGTKDTVAMAWRFALCEKFFSNESGFIILDDPMVDIDPERRKDVVQAIKSFSEQYQTILMTCHPAHAKQLTDDMKIVNV